jgi:hypothetical protein
MCRTAQYLIMCLTVTACTTARSADLAIWGDPPQHLKGDIVTEVEWLSPSAVYVRCAQILMSFAQAPIPSHSCAYKTAGGKITLVLPNNLHPLIVHELAHAHQMAKSLTVDHEGWQRFSTPQ